MKIKRNLFAIIAMVLCMGIFAGCAKQEEEPQDAQMLSEIAEASGGILEQLAAFDDEMLKGMIEQYEDSGESAMAGAMESWLTTKEELGSFVKVESSSTEFKDKQYVCSVNASFEKRALDATIVFTKQGMLVNMEFAPVYTLRENMGRAAIHTLIGMGTVFIVLIFISLIIGCFKYINQWEKSKAVKALAAVPAPAAPAPAPAPAPAYEAEEELADDLELVAVITAAIAASENTSADGLVVRSIRRKSGAKWKRA